MASGQEKNRQRMKQLLGKPGNGNCADCGAAGRLEARNIWVMLSYNYFVYPFSGFLESLISRATNNFLQSRHFVSDSALLWRSFIFLKAVTMWFRRTKRATRGFLAGTNNNSAVLLFEMGGCVVLGTQFFFLMRLLQNLYVICWLSPLANPTVTCCHTTSRSHLGALIIPTIQRTDTCWLTDVICDTRLKN